MILRSGDEPDQIGKGEGSAGDNDRHYVPGLPVERPMTSPSSYDSSPRRNSSHINQGLEEPALATLLRSVVVSGRRWGIVTRLSPLASDHREWMARKVPRLEPMKFASE